MQLFNSPVKKLIEKVDADGLHVLLEDRPNLANENISIPFEVLCRKKAHPLHRICDPVFSGKITDEDATLLAKVFLSHGARINGDMEHGEGSPLLAAASLKAEQVGMLLIDEGADIHYTYQNDGVSPLHWASYCGLNLLVARLIEAKAEIDKQDKNYDSTPLGWALHALESVEEGKEKKQAKCVQLLLEAGADIEKLDEVKKAKLVNLAKHNTELKVFMPQ